MRNQQDDENVYLGANNFYKDLKEQKENYKMSERARKGYFYVKLAF